MQSSKVIHTISCHAEGEVGDVIVDGGVFRHFNLLVPAKSPKADMGWIIMEPEDTPPMSGSNSICVATVLLEAGILSMVESVTELTLEAPGGLVKMKAQCKDGKVITVRIYNHPSFVSALNQTIEVEGLGSVKVDIAYGGDSFAIVNALSVGLNLTPSEGKDITAIGAKITQAANQKVGFNHPENEDWKHISFCQLTLPTIEEGGIKSGKSAVVIQPGKIDRSPCGTGCSARLALIHAKGEIEVGEPYIGRSIIGSRFDCKIESLTSVNNVPAMLPSLQGRAWITGSHQHMLSPTDPWPQGYKVLASQAIRGLYKVNQRMKKTVLVLSLLFASATAQAEVTTMACKSYDVTYTLARLYLKNALLTLQQRLDEYGEAGMCDQITIPDKTYMVKMEKGQADLDQWLIETNALAANFERPPITERFFFVSITLPEGGEVYSLESTRFIE